MLPHTRLYAVGDLHGRHDLLLKALDAAYAHADGQPQTIVFLGDYVDRGPESRQIIETLMQGATGRFAGWTWVPIIGNHEQMMVHSYRTGKDIKTWMTHGGGATLLSYGAEEGVLVSPFMITITVPKAHVDWLANLPCYHQAGNLICVHAGLDPAVPTGEQDPPSVTWHFYGGAATPLYQGKYHIIHGHEQKEHGGPQTYGGRTNLDTLAWATGRLVVGVFDPQDNSGPIDLLEVTE